jgi:N-acetylated-alpha-linked acidic dipeptidase
MNHFGDPGYHYHTLMSQLWGVLALRLANADLLPFDFANYAANIREFVNELSKGKDLHQLDLTPVLNAIDNFETAGKQLNDATTHALSSGAIDHDLAARINAGSMQLERNWLNPDGIPGRPWFKHILYGARFTYAHLELPALAEAVEKQDWTTATQQSKILQQALEKNTTLINELTGTLTRP